MNDPKVVAESPSTTNIWTQVKSYVLFSTGSVRRKKESSPKSEQRNYIRAPVEFAELANLSRWSYVVHFCAYKMRIHFSRSWYTTTVELFYIRLIFIFYLVRNLQTKRRRNIHPRHDLNISLSLQLDTSGNTYMFYTSSINCKCNDVTNR